MGGGSDVGRRGGGRQEFREGGRMLGPPGAVVSDPAACVGSREDRGGMRPGTLRPSLVLD